MKVCESVYKYIPSGEDTAFFEVARSVIAMRPNSEIISRSRSHGRERRGIVARNENDSPRGLNSVGASARARARDAGASAPLIISQTERERARERTSRGIIVACRLKMRAGNRYGEGRKERDDTEESGERARRNAVGWDGGDEARTVEGRGISREGRVSVHNRIVTCTSGSCFHNYGLPKIRIGAAA